MIPLSEMVGRAELEDHFRDAPADDVLAFVEMLGTERDLKIARLLPFKGRIALLWDLMQKHLKASGEK